MRYATPVFTIEAGGKDGSEPTLFFVHSGVASQRSKALYALFEGNWREKKERKIYWNEWDVATVARFVDWLYTEQYRKLDKSYIAMAEPDADSEQENTHESDCTITLLPILKLYHMATYYAVGDLENCAIRDLQAILYCEIVKYDRPCVVKHLADAIRYAYDNLPERPNDMEGAAKELLQFVAETFDKFVKVQEAQELLREGGDFVADVCLKLCGRLKPSKRYVYARIDSSHA